MKKRVGLRFMHSTLPTVCVILSINIFSQEFPKIRIDPARAYGGNVSEYFESVEYIPLETTKESLFGTIGNLTITDSSIVVYDYDTNNLLFFYITGKFIRKIKIPSGYYPSISFDEKQKKLRVYVLNHNGKEDLFSWVSLMGDIIGNSKKFSRNTEVYLHGLDDGFHFKLNNCSIGQSDKLKDAAVDLITVYKMDSPYKVLLRTELQNNALYCSSGFGSGSINIDGSSIYFCRYLYNDIYKITRDSAFLITQFIFPAKNSIPNNILRSNNLKTVDSMLNIMSYDRNLIIGIKDIKYINDSLLAFNIMYRNPIVTDKPEANQQFNFIYNMQKKKSISFERLFPDIGTQYLPIIDGTYTSIIGLSYNKGHFYTNISSLKMFMAYKKNKPRNPQYPPVLQEYFKTQNRKSNPVIVKMKLKE